MPKIITTKTHSSGIALGGIGAGSVELFPDGEFHSWLIANQPRITKVCFEDKADDGESSTGALSFYVREKKPDGKRVVRKLGMKTDADDFTYRMFSWNKPVEKIEFDGKFPVAELTLTVLCLAIYCSGRLLPLFRTTATFRQRPAFIWILQWKILRRMSLK